MPVAAAAAAVAQAPARPDGRFAHELRPMACELGLLNRADGSCRFSHGDSTVLASVFGPLQPKRQRKQLIDRASLEVSFRPRTGIPGQLEREREAAIQGALSSVVLASLHPRTCITVVLQVVHEDGSITAAAMNAAFLALLDAGVPLQGMLSCVTAGLLLPNPSSESAGGKAGGKAGKSGKSADSEMPCPVVTLDPIGEEEKASVSIVTVAVPSGACAKALDGSKHKGGIALCDCVGRSLDENTFNEATAAAKGAATKVVQFMKMAVEKRVLRMA